MTIISITPKLLISMSDGTTMEINLNTVPQAGCEATQRWLATQLKPNPADPYGPAINKYADDSSSGPEVLIRNLGNEILLGKVADFCSVCPSPELIAAQQQAIAAQQAVEALRRAEAGL